MRAPTETDVSKSYKQSPSIVDSIVQGYIEAYGNRVAGDKILWRFQDLISRLGMYRAVRLLGLRYSVNPTVGPVLVCGLGFRVIPVHWKIRVS